jgi:hypothetical protein
MVKSIIAKYLAARTLLLVLIEARQYSRPSPYRLQRVFHMMVITYSEDPLPMVSPKFGGHTLKGVDPKIRGGLWKGNLP